MKKILSPISRWQFFLTVFITNLLFKPACYFLIIQCVVFLQVDFNYVNPLIIGLIWLILPALILLLACYKRLFDIYDNIKQVIGATLFIAISWLIAFFVLMKPVFNIVGNYDLNYLLQFQANATNQLYYHIICALFFIYLIFKKGRNCTNKLTRKTIAKRTALLILIYCIMYTTSQIALSFNFMPVNDLKMVQTIDSGDTILSYKYFKHESLKRFDVVTVRDENFGLYNTSIRIIGLPNEKIEIKNNQIYVNNDLIEDRYGYYAEKLMPVNIGKTITLDNNSYFLMGDNRYWRKGGKYLSKNKKTGKEVWHDINDEIGFIVSKDKITGKIIAINYKDYSKDEKYENSIKRNKTGIKILTKGKTLELNPSQLSINLFGKNTKGN